MERESKKVILVNSSQVTELIKKLIEMGSEAISKENSLHLADYSTQFYNIR